MTHVRAGDQNQLHVTRQPCISCFMFQHVFEEDLAGSQLRPKEEIKM